MTGGYSQTTCCHRSEISLAELKQTEWLEHYSYFAENDVEDPAKKRRYCCQLVEHVDYKLIRSLVPAERSEHYLVQRPGQARAELYIVQRWKFNTQAWHTGESVATYVAGLRELAEYCGSD